MKEFVALDVLIAEARTAMEPLGHSTSTRWQYDYAWRKFQAHCLAQGSIVFSSTLAEQYVHKLRDQYEAGTLKPWKFKLIRKATGVLADYAETGEVHWRPLPRWGAPVWSSSLFHTTVLTQYRQHLKAAAYGRGTQEFYAVVGKQFLQYLERAGILTGPGITRTEVSQFIPHAATTYQPTSMRTVLSAVRHFLRFMEDTGITVAGLGNAVPRSFGRKTAIVPMLTDAEERQLLAAIDRTTVVGRRDFAIVLLALRLGLRAVDIAQLRVTDIHWQTHTVTVVQQKTGRRLDTPLLADVGNAIIDYLLHGRPNVPSPQVFLRSQAPYIPFMEGHGISHVVRAALNRAKIRQEPGQHKGSHILRHSLAARLLAAETPLPVISSVLGHANKDTTKIYLSTDTEHLRLCALGLEGIEVTGEAVR